MRNYQISKVIGDTAFRLPTGWKLILNHYHPNNSSKKERHNSKYLTVLDLLDEDGITVHSTSARCCRLDTPIRKLGAEIASHRMKKWMDKNADVLFPEDKGILQHLFG